MTRLDHILVVGAGSLGTLFAARLAARRPSSVTLLARPAAASVLRRDGVVVTEMDGTTTGVGPDGLTVATSADEVRRPVDAVVLAVKSADLEGSLAVASAVADASTVVLPLQNGVGHLARLVAHAGPGLALGGTTMEGAALEGPGRVHHLLAASTLVGRFDGRPDARVDALVATLSRAGLPTSATALIVPTMWAKFVQSCAASSVCGLTRLGLTTALSSPEGAALQLALVREGLAVMAAHGVDMAPGLAQLDELRELAGLDDDVAVARLMARATEQRARGYVGATSLLRDLEAGRPTEAPFLMGAMVRLAEDAGVAVPALRTAARAVAAADAAAVAAERSA